MKKYHPKNVTCNLISVIMNLLSIYVFIYLLLFKFILPDATSKQNKNCSP